MADVKELVLRVLLLVLRAALSVPAVPSMWAACWMAAASHQPR